jgi:hypothetical protein
MSPQHSTNRKVARPQIITHPCSPLSTRVLSLERGQLARIPSASPLCSEGQCIERGDLAVCRA